MSQRIPYTYYVFHKPTGLKYYGSKYKRNANPNTFWKLGGYFTSSKKIKKLILEYGLDSFKAEVRKIFTSPDEALNYEYKFLKKVKALLKNDWLNDNYGGEKFRNVGPASPKALQAQRNKKQSPESNIKRSNSLKGRIISDETRQKMSDAQKNRSLEKETIRREKIRKHALGRNQSEKVKKELSMIVSNTRWVNDTKIQKKITKDELQNYIDNGWHIGRIIKILTCPHCGLSGVNYNLVRKHFDKCKHKK